MPALAAAVSATPAPHAVPTFESLGLYYTRPVAQNGCKVRYRGPGAEWREGYPLVYDTREQQYRGSLVGLTPKTKYEIRFECDSESVDLEASTLDEQFPIGKITRLDGGRTDQPLIIREGGTAEAWHLVTPASGTKFVSDVFNAADYNVVVEADYVILRGLELRNAAIHGVLV
ncbi:MAG TPA: hypothetical protein VFL57_07180, partial [Bryobacteraceae bacterium]|nr:hypothetical protein [Bryobacteraceae bacterium]